jgi:hypothetical protein
MQERISVAETLANFIFAILTIDNMNKKSLEAANKILGGYLEGAVV